MTKPVKWLDRQVAPPGPHLCLCLSQAEFDAARAGLEIEEQPCLFVNPGAHATTHHYTNPYGRRACIVCLSDEATIRDPVEVAALLVHEAVHVWQEHCRSINDFNPGHEQEAYAIQYVSETLMTEYARRLKLDSADV